MAVYGYHRTSTTEQHLDRGIKEITDFCTKNNYQLEKIYTVQQTGKNFNRPRYIVLRDDILRNGDTLIITEVDRLGRSKKETVEELRKLTNRDIRVMILEIPRSLGEIGIITDAHVFKSQVIGMGSCLSMIRLIIIGAHFETRIMINASVL